MSRFWLSGGVAAVVAVTGCGRLESEETASPQRSDIATKSDAVTAGCPTDWTGAPVSCVGLYYIIDGTGRCMRRNSAGGFDYLGHDVCKANSGDRTHLIFQAPNGTYGICRPNSFAKTVTKETRHGVAGTLTTYQANCAFHNIDTIYMYFHNANLAGAMTLATVWVDDKKALPPEETWMSQGAIAEPVAPGATEYYLKWFGDGRYLTKKDSNSYVGLYGLTYGANQKWHVEAPWK